MKQYVILIDNEIGIIFTMQNYYFHDLQIWERVNNFN